MSRANQNETRNQNYWNRISVISFILAVMVIIRHNSSVDNYSEMGFVADAFSVIYYRFKGSITEITVPMFFLIAGFNFYNGFTNQKWKNKIKRRIKSLAAPYFVWNTVYCAFMLIASNTLISRFFIGREKYAFSIGNILKGCLYHWNCNSHFWFVFNLMLFAIISPLVYFLLKRKKAGAIVLAMSFVTIICFGFALPEKLIYRTDSFFYYFLGAYLGLHCSSAIAGSESVRFVSFFRERKILSISLGFCLIASTFLLLIDDLYGGLRSLIICLGIAGLWMVSISWSDEKPKCIPSGGTIFLMYAVHGIIQPIVVKLLYLVLPKLGWMSIVNFVLAVGLTILSCFLLRLITFRFLKPIDHIICGWRK